MVAASCGLTAAVSVAARTIPITTAPKNDVTCSKLPRARLYGPCSVRVANPRPDGRLFQRRFGSVAMDEDH